MIYRKKVLQEMIPWEEGMDMSGVSMTGHDSLQGSPKIGDMIAISRRPSGVDNKWLVTEEFFKTNYEAVK